MKTTVSLLTSLFAFTAVAQEKKPNVILIYADDLGYGDLECYGSGSVATPNVNRLAAEGVRFTSGYACASTSTPSRYALFTGEYAFRREGTDVAAGNAGMIIRPEDYTIGDVFKNEGYATGAIGKWHLGLGNKSGEQDWNAPLPAGLGDLGFDYSYIMAATGDRVPCVFIENGRVANYDAEHPIEVSYEKPFPGEPLGRTNPELLYNQKPSHGHDMAIVNGISRIGYSRGGGKALWKDENIADSITHKAVRFISENKDNPFFLYFGTNDVHVPRFPHPRFRGKSEMGLRGEAILQFDWCVGQLMAALDSLGLTENTLIILSSDNGPVVDDGYEDKAEELLGNHKPWGPLRGAKYSAFEGGTRVPLIVSWKGNTPKGITSDVLISQIDFMKSMASLIGARLPKGAAPDSYNRLTNWLGADKTDRPWILEQSNTLSVRTRDFKYIDPLKGPAMVPWGPKIETGYSVMPQLYEMKSDGERKNVAEKNPKQVFEMQELLRDIRSRRAVLK
jgi:arylsulfatase A-like enzyme